MTIPNFVTRYDRVKREWGAYSARRLFYIVNCPASADHGKRFEIAEGFYLGAGSKNRRYADAWVAQLNASDAYVPLLAHTCHANKA